MNYKHIFSIVLIFVIYSWLKIKIDKKVKSKTLTNDFDYSNSEFRVTLEKPLKY